MNRLEKSLRQNSSQPQKKLEIPKSGTLAF